MIFAKDLEEHQDRLCEFRDVECHLKCGAIMKIPALEQHLEECPLNLQLCDLECGESFPKYALHQHRLHDCPNREVFCPLGCRMYPFTVRACDVQHHVAYECPKRISHLRLDVTKPAQDGNSTCPRCHIRLKATDIENHMFYHCPLLTNHKGLGIMR